MSFWYNSAFGSPVARVQGVGYVQELVARLTQERIPEHEHRFSTNSTLDNDSGTFPFGDSLYVDATHEVVVLNSECRCKFLGRSSLSPFIVITALNLTSFAAGGPLPYDHIPEKRTFKVSELAPFATNIQFQCMLPDIFPLYAYSLVVPSSARVYFDPGTTDSYHHKRWRGAINRHSRMP